MLKPIQTFYKGYNFRSRLEARWAVFFDTLGCQWVYEPEGFDLGGIYYLPDFYVTYGNGSQYWFEVKSSINNLTSKEVKKMILFSEALNEGNEHGMASIILLDGPPSLGAYHPFHSEGVGYECTYGSQDSTDKKIKDAISFLKKEGTDPLKRFGDVLLDHEGDHRIYVAVEGSYAEEPYGLLIRLHQAVFAARSARFEYGETPSLL